MSDREKQAAAELAKQTEKLDAAQAQKLADIAFGMNLQKEISEAAENTNS